MKLGPPSGTLAILVGIEKYAEERWELNGPAMDALRLADWLRSQGVPGCNIRLYLSLGDRNDEKFAAARDTQIKALKEYGAEIHHPTRAALERGLNPAHWPEMSDEQDPTLLVYFSGHGLQSEIKGERYVVAADASGESYDAIDLDALAVELRLVDSPRRYKRQLLIQDACAEPVGDRRIRALGVKIRDTENTSTLQYCLFATRPGEMGRNNPTLQAGEFTTALLDILQRSSLDGLDVGNVYDQLEAVMRGRLQHPVLYRRDEYLAVSTLTPGNRTGSAALQQLIDVVSGLRAVSANLLPPIFRGIAQSDLAIPAGVADMLRLLDSLVGPPDQGLSNVELFAVRLQTKIARVHERAAGDDTVRYAEALSTLGNWIDTWPGKRAGPALTVELERLKAETRQADNVDTIVLDPGGQPDPDETRVWYYLGGQFSKAETIPTPGAGIPERLSAALQHVCVDGIYRDVILELVLPVDSLFDTHAGIKIAVGKVAKYYLGTRPLLLALRIAERWHAQGWHNSWQSRWKDAALLPDAIPKVVWLAPKERPPASGWAWLGMEHPGTPEHREAMVQALFEGAAFATWCGKTHTTEVTKAVERHNYVDLLETMRLLADMNENDGSITCMVDDPTRLPPGAGGVASTFHQPLQRR